jgi:hypothetical protein
MGKDEQAEPRRHEDTKETDVGRGLVPLTGEGLTGTGAGSGTGSQDSPSHRRPGSAAARDCRHRAGGDKPLPYFRNDALGG